MFADVANHLIQDLASAYDLLLWPKHVFPPVGRPLAGRRSAAAGRRWPPAAAGQWPPAAAGCRRPPIAGGRRPTASNSFMASGQADVSILWPRHVIYILGSNHIVFITWIHVIGPSL